MMKKLLISVFCSFMLLTGCQEMRIKYSDKEYVMFSDTMSVNTVLKDVESFNVPVVSTVACDYDRTFGVEIIDRGSSAIEGLNYRLRSNTVTIKAGETSANVEVIPSYDSFNETDSLSFSMQLVIPDNLKWNLYGDRTKVVMYKVCPFSMENFSGYCVVTSLFLYSYPGMENTSYQRLVKTRISEEKENTIIMEDWLFTGYDVTLTFNPSDPANPKVTMDKDQVLSDELSVFGQINGDNKILVTSSPAYLSYFNSCEKFVALWIRVYVKDMGTSVGDVGNFYNLIEWISDEEAERLQREEGM